MEDKEIIKLYLDRSESAIAETAEKYGAFCHAIARNILADDADAEECVNDAYFALWNRIPPCVPTSLKAFVGKIVRNVSLDRFDYNTASCRFDGMDCIFDEVAGMIPSPDAEVSDDNIVLTGCINAFLAGEKETSRLVFMRRYWFCDSVKEIGKRYGMSEGRVKSILFRERKRLSAYLKKEGFDFESERMVAVDK